MSYFSSARGRLQPLFGPKFCETVAAPLLPQYHGSDKTINKIHVRHTAGVYFLYIYCVYELPPGSA